MSFYSKESLNKLEEHFLTIKGRYQRLMSRYASRHFVHPVAREYATHGYTRRLKILARCIENVFEILPPSRTGLPTSDELSDCTISIQAFVFNAFGSIDNLAWIWALEKQLTKNGKLLSKRDIGLRSHNLIMRNSFSLGFRQYLDTLEPWFKGMGSFRDALAHRIPLYIPPYLVARSDTEAYNSLTERMLRALIEQNMDEYEALQTKQNQLGKYRPVMMHSISENVGIINFHPQILADFGAIELLGRKMLQELNANPATTRYL